MISSLPPGAKLGPCLVEEGCIFSIYSEHAESIELCLFDHAQAFCESSRVPLVRGEGNVWSVFVPGVEDGQLYGYRVSGEFTPAKGLLFNPKKLLFDPYAFALGRSAEWNESLLTFQGASHKLPRRDDTAPYAPLARVVKDNYSWKGDVKPATPWNRTVIYETHLKGFTRLHPNIPPEIRGTYMGMADEAAIRYLKELGVTAVEFLPLHLSLDEHSLSKRGVSNYWGYSTLGYFIPDERFGVPGHPLSVRDQFREMVRAFHAEGIEVILDVVYNHTCEGGLDGMTVSCRGIDNLNYYFHSREKPGELLDFTGCGNSLRVEHPRVLQLVLDSLRYWVTEMRVDGFRFDLATTLARDSQGSYSPHAAFLSAILQDPTLSSVKLIAEPWDIGYGGYQVGAFPAGWREWNDQYRDVVRRFWKREPGLIGGLATRIAGSSDIYQRHGRPLQTSVNFVTCHDGFTMRDLVSYSQKHNEANGEKNRDGNDSNHSMNFGTEGESEDAKVEILRARQVRSFLATLFLSAGVPMLSGGDEIGKTQQGNNNAYCQDNELSWHDWTLPIAKMRLLEFTKHLISLRREMAVFARTEFFSPEREEEDTDGSLRWLHARGTEMSGADWQNGNLHTIGALFLGGKRERAKNSRTVIPSYLIVFNADTVRVDFRLPNESDMTEWFLELDTADETVDVHSRRISGGATFALEPHAVALFKSVR